MSWTTPVLLSLSCTKSSTLRPVFLTYLLKKWRSACQVSSTFLSCFCYALSLSPPPPPPPPLRPSLPPSCIHVQEAGVVTKDHLSQVNDIYYNELNQMLKTSEEHSPNVCTHTCTCKFTSYSCPFADVPFIPFSKLIVRSSGAVFSRPPIKSLSGTQVCLVGEII